MNYGFMGLDIEERNRHNKGYVQFRKFFDMAMGLLYVVCGILAILAKKRELTITDNASMGFFMALGGLFILYGGYRVYRGIKHIF